MGNPDLWLCALLFIVTLTYLFNYRNPSVNLQPLLLVVGAAFGKGVLTWVLWADRKSGKRDSEKRETRNIQHSTSNIQPATGSNGVSTETTVGRVKLILTILVLLLAGAALWQPETTPMEYQYRGIRRWSGAWDNPNIYGMLMAVGLVLAVGITVQSLKSKVQSPPTKEKHSTFNIQHSTTNGRLLRGSTILLFAAATALCGIGLFKSYSRGAWLGAAIGVGYLVWKTVTEKSHLTPALSPRPTGGEGESSRRFSCVSCVSWLKRNSLPLSVILLSILVLSFWQFRHTEWPPARRVFSVTNLNDFSWRNRVTAWQGAIRMMADRPLAGFGWGKAEAAYRNDYRAPRLEETAAIQMNDYFMLGISAGAPALLCFVGYIALSFRQSRGDPPSSILYPPSSFSSCSRAGALVLLTGFWFDGGLFKLATAVVFWTLLELGRLISMDDPERRFPNRLVSGDTQQSAGSETGAPSIGNPRAARVLWWIAGLFAFVAVALTAIHVITPRLSVSDRTLAIARNRLVQPAHRDDFDFLAAEPTPTPSQEGSLWRGKQLSILLDHVALADYNRTLVRWTIDDDLYRNFVLSPQISPAYDTEMNWRRCLWEHFYPRIRRESDPQAAVEIVIRELSRSLELQTDSSAPMSIRVIWTTGRADAAGFEAVAVAALRAIGIPARLDESGSKGEWFDGGNWRALPDARL